ncbi:MAG TPA: hypothetical protein DEH78_19340 [Solibacterales bacterium]|nr:hypothetical protein [Bryobacterales bacterium]
MPDEPRGGDPNDPNLRSPDLDLRWSTPEERLASLHRLYAYANGVATAAAKWYWDKKKWKKFPSQVIRFAAILLTATAGLLPIVRAIWRIPIDVPNPELAVSLLLGLATALVGLDRFGGFSTGWMRYVKYATAIERIQYEFKLDWTARLAEVPDGPGAARDIAPAVLQGLIERAKQMILAIQDQVAKETGEWAAEFEKNLTQLESDVRSQWAEYRKRADEQAAAERPGHIVVVVKNALKLDEARFHVELRPPQGTAAGESADLRGTQTWVRTNVPPGTYALAVSGTLGGQHREAHALAVVEAGKRTDVELEVPS